MTTTRFFCAGVPVTQGSKRGFVVNGRVVLKESTGERLKDWRYLLSVSARDEWGERPPMDGPVTVVAVFTIPKPASAPKRRRTWPIAARSGDLDKLARAVLDSITGVIVKDDSQVVALHATKDWADEFIGPGVSIHVCRVPDMPGPEQ